MKCRGLFIAACIWIVHGCGCSDTGISGDLDGSDTTPVDTMPSDTVTDPGIDPSCPDRDGDGHHDPACGGDDCDDEDADVYPGADEVCLDGVDQDCDTVVDGPQVIVADHVIIPEPSWSVDRHDLVWAGSEYGIVFKDGVDSLLLQRVSPVATPRGAGPTTVAVVDSISDRLGVVWTGSEYSVVFSRGWEPSDLYLARLDGLGATIGSERRLTDDPNISANPSVVWTGSELGFVWMDSRVTGASCTMTSCQVDAFFGRATAEGNRIGEDLRLSDETIWSAQPGWAWSFWTGEQYGVSFWQWFTSVSSSGVETGSDVSLDVAEFGVPTWTGSEYAVLWYREDPEDRGLFITRLDGSGAEIGTQDVVTDVRVNHLVSLVWTGSEYAAAFEMSLDSDPCVHVALIEPGAIGPRATLPVAGCMAHLSSRSLVWTGSELGVTWTVWSEGLYMARIVFCD